MYDLLHCCNTVAAEPSRVPPSRFCEPESDAATFYYDGQKTHAYGQLRNVRLWRSPRESAEGFLPPGFSESTESDTARSVFAATEACPENPWHGPAKKRSSIDRGPAKKSSRADQDGGDGENPLHHSKLHRGSTTQDFAAPPTTEAISLQSNSLSTHVATSAAIASHTSTNERATILGTARARAVNTRGEELLVRVLTDPASEGSFVSEHVVQMLALQKKLTPLSVSGAGGQVSAKTKSSVSITLHSTTIFNASISFAAAVLPKISTLLPKRAINGTRWAHLKGLALADPLYHTPAPVDCLIGAELYPEIIKAGLRLGPIGSPMAYDSIFGWIVTGPTDIQQAHPDVIGSFKLTVVPMASISHELRKFWELEEVQLLPHDDACRRRMRETSFALHIDETKLAVSSSAYLSLQHQQCLALMPLLSRDFSLSNDACSKIPS
ncbi:unnamed protein product [Trichogramma brassicae]|uniref:Uncharacterized protein n=1 Tax=Trichogramma brassicae TaxID=86971 RepID=A0A6H5J577_9HYME|nr:unnamed protein product [Trichogramma brassicae]